jgi:2-dehydro-3-deoxyphosphogalactonate aldolase
MEAGADGFGLGGGLYKPGQDARATLEKARAYVAAVKQ